MAKTKRYAHGAAAVLILVLIVAPFQLTIGRMWQPKDRWAWKWIGDYFEKNLPKP